MSQLAVVIAPDSFKGSLDAAAVAAAIAEGWRQHRGHDELTLLPQADGGEGTVDAVAAARPGSVRHWVDAVVGPDLRSVRACWLELPDATAVVELAQSSGLPLMAHLDPLGATTLGLGQLIDAALDHGARRVLVGLGGSASTDGGSGALSALGMSLLDADGHLLPPGGASLARLSAVRGTPRAPAELFLLTDVSSPLLGPGGAAHVFGPQKGASPAQVEVLEQALARFADVLGGPHDQPGMGAAGGCGYGLAAGLGGTIVGGAAYLSELTGYDDVVTTADVVLSGEGRFDATSLSGKVVGHVLELATRPEVRRGVIAGQVAVDVPGLWTQSLLELAGSVPAAMAEPTRWLVEAGRIAAARLG